MDHSSKAMIALGRLRRRRLITCQRCGNRRYKLARGQYCSATCRVAAFRARSKVVLPGNNGGQAAPET